MDFTEFFRKATSSTPYPYQTRLSKGLWPSLLEIPTGLSVSTCSGPTVII